jgi:hypothetical protein
MICTGAQYPDGLRDGREVWSDGERGSAQPALRPISVQQTAQTGINP